MTTSFYNGVSGLKSFQYGIDTWAYNIANVNTIGFKENIPEFSTLFSNIINNTPISSDTGTGTKLSSTAIDLKEGNLIYTDNPFDLAINGEGWFAVSDNNQTYYTKTGSFTRDVNGNLVDDNGNYLLVANANNLIQNPDGSYSIDTSIPTNNLLSQTTQITPITLPNNVILPAVATSKIDFTTNLNDADIITTTSPATTESDFSALYSKDGEDLKVRDGDSLVFGFGNPATYENNLISTEICLNAEEANGEDTTYNFTLNGKEFNIIIPDGSSKSEVKNIFKNKFDEAGIINQTTDEGIKISDPKQIILKSSNEDIPSIAVAKITYNGTPSDEYEFATIEDFDNIIQNLANNVYPDVTTVYLDEKGRICIDNNFINNTTII